MENWYKDWFASEFYLKVYSHRNNEDAQNLLDLIKNNIPINDKSVILDAACGNGRHAKQFAKLGCSVFGFDLSKPLLKIAAEQNYKNLNFICADIRNVPFKNKFDIILNMFTSFGYFNNDVENSKFIKYASDHISKAGYFVFDYLNPTYVVNNLIKSSEKSIDDYNIVEHRSIENNRVQKEIVISNSDNLHRFYESVRLYSYQEIVTMFKMYGFQIIKEFGDYKGNIYDEKTSERMILFFTKK